MLADQDSLTLDRIAHVRRFNRFYTRVLGVLNDEYLESGFSLTEVRVLYELVQHESVTAAWLSRELGLDPGYLSRLLSGLESRGFITRAPSAADGRQSTLSLRPEGREAFDRLDTIVRTTVSNVLTPLSEEQQQALVDAMQTIETILNSVQRKPSLQ